MLFIPFAVSTLDRPRALLADPGLPLAFDAAPLWQQVLGQPLHFDVAGGLSGLAPFAGGPVPWALLLALLTGAPVLVLAVAALFLPSRRALVARALWVAALIALAGGWLAGHVATAAGAQVLVPPFPGAAVSAAIFALLGAALIGGESLLDLAGDTAPGAVAPAAPPRQGRRAVVRATAGLATALLLAGPLAGLAAWTAQNVAPAGRAVPAGPAGAAGPRCSPNGGRH